MKRACQQFIADRLQDLTLPDGNTKPFKASDPDRNIFFRDMPRDFLKDNDYAVAVFAPIDRTRKNGRFIAKTRTMTPATETDPEQWSQTLLRRRYNREIIFRCLLFAPADQLWGTESYVGLLEQLNQAVAEYHHILDSDNHNILVESQDMAQPWDSETERDRKLDRPPLGIFRVQFSGGVHTSRDQMLITSVSLTPQNQ